MNTFWRLIVEYSARALLGLGALVFGALAVWLGIPLWEFNDRFGLTSLFDDTRSEGVLSLEKFGGGMIPITEGQLFAVLTVPPLLLGSMSLACAYFAFRSDNPEAAKDS